MIDVDIFDFKKANIILVGEIHGIKENVEVLRSLVSSYLRNMRDRRLVLAFEWPHELTGEISTYLKNRAPLDWRKWNFRTYHDGRISREHINFLKWVKKVNKKLPRNCVILVRCFDVGAKRWNERDKKMARLLLRGGISKNVTAIAMMGNLHARRKKFSLEGVQYIPLGYHMPRNAAVSVKLEYLSGSFYNMSLKKISPKKKNAAAMSRLEKINKKLGYDRTCFLERAHPVKPLS